MYQFDKERNKRKILLLKIMVFVIIYGTNETTQSKSEPKDSSIYFNLFQNEFMYNVHKRK